MEKVWTQDLMDITPTLQKVGHLLISDILSYVNDLIT